jgi:hypothetical protein
MDSLQQLIDEAHELSQDLPRPHMGCSLLGHHCDRWLWLNFRWAVIEQFPGRIKRLFRRGQLEEKTVVDDLGAVGMVIKSTGADQSRVSFGCHVSGSVDGVIESGVPGSAQKKQKHILEIKTHSLKSFDDLEKNGVKQSKFMHWVQMQLYMLGSGIDRALYVAVCKNDDRIHSEVVEFDSEEANKALERGKRITTSDRMPEPISADPSWYLCKFCPGHDLCHGSKTTKEVNCRTCAHSTAKPDGTWRCERFEADDIPIDWQRKGCESHVLHPDMVPWQMKQGRDRWTAIYMIDGKAVANGEADATVFSSKEILANPLACAHGNAFVKTMRTDFDGEIIG